MKILGSQEAFHSPSDVRFKSLLRIKPSMNRSDWITWSLSPNGIYSVASNYKLRFRNSDIAECSNKYKEEDIIHALWLCPKAQTVWKHLGFPKIIPRNIKKAADVFWWLYDHLLKEDFIKFMGLTWLVWQRRNSFVFQHKIIDDKIWTSWALDLIALHLEPHQQTLKNPTIQPNLSWQPPPQNFFLINSHASLVFGQAGCGISVVIRDPNGSLVVAKTAYIPACFSVLLAEAAAILLGVQLAIRWSISNAQVGSNS
ncbi:hypothetical protein G4B88_001077 [Cannabis sativa]|uniref:RNase H type-1 domain-containing protein n=1 Tax=Cannabis sativa TaxID=3483 RepID=A0A7J6EFS4_CANSA|nr:hypothetical protein G4B88_001077 [Cannabis sativa]